MPGDSTAILFSSPVFVMMFSVCLLRERCQFVKVFGAGLLIAGVILVARPPGIFGTRVEDFDVVGKKDDI